MFFYEGCQCPVCGKSFQESDDIVVCPQCGAPHHRACWKQEGHCHYENTHGSGQQWKRPEPEPRSPAAGPVPPSPNGEGKQCPHCGWRNPQFAEFCSRCGQELPAADWNSQPPPYSAGTGSPIPPPGGAYGEYAPFRVPTVDPYGGVSPQETIEDIPAEEWLSFTAVNTAYYLPRFKRIAQGKKVSWNWPAFLLTPYWLMYRKNYLAGSLLLLFSVLKTFVETLVTYRFLITDPLTTTADYFSAIQAAALDESKQIFFTILFLFLLAEIALRVLFGLFGNYVYYHTALHRMQQLRRKNPDTYRARLAPAGGISFAFAALSYAVLQFASMLMVMLI